MLLQHLFEIGKDSPFATALILVIGAASICHGKDEDWTATSVVIGPRHILVLTFENLDDLVVDDRYNGLEIAKTDGKDRWSNDDPFYILTTKLEMDNITPFCILDTKEKKLQPGTELGMLTYDVEYAVRTRLPEPFSIEKIGSGGAHFLVATGEGLNPKQALVPCHNHYMTVGLHFYKNNPSPSSYAFHTISPETKKWMEGIVGQELQARCGPCLDQTPWVARIMEKDGNLFRWGVSPLTGVLVSSGHVLVMTWGTEGIRNRMTADNLQVSLGFDLRNVFHIQWLDTGREHNPYAILTLASRMTAIPPANILKTNEVSDMMSLGDPVTVLAWNDANELTAFPGKFRKTHNLLISVTMPEEMHRLGLALVKREGEFAVAGFFVNYNGTLVHNFLTFSPRIEGEVKKIRQRASG